LLRRFQPPVGSSSTDAAERPHATAPHVTARLRQNRAQSAAAQQRVHRVVGRIGVKIAIDDIDPRPGMSLVAKVDARENR
jgi:hypothetical protein